MEDEMSRFERLDQLHVMALNLRNWAVDYEFDFGVDMDAPSRLADELMSALADVMVAEGFLDG